MPKAYTEEERTIIKQRLIESGTRRFSQFGLRKTSIDELIKDVAIGKGSFYQFFDSKEALFFAILEQIESESKRELDKICKASKNSRKMVRDFFFAIAGHLSQNPFLQVLGNQEEFEHLLRHISPEMLAEHQKSDEAFYKKHFRRWIREGHVQRANENALMGVVKAIFVLHQQKLTMGKSFEETLDLLIGSVSEYVSR